MDQAKVAEELLGSKSRIRVLQVLSEYGELNISEVSRRTGLNYTIVERHLLKLQELGLVNEKRYGKIRIVNVLFKAINFRFEKGGIFKMEILDSDVER